MEIDPTSLPELWETAQILYCLDPICLQNKSEHTPLQKDPKQQELKAILRSYVKDYFKALFDSGP